MFECKNRSECCSSTSTCNARLLSPTVSACAGTAIFLQVKNPVVGVTYKWYDSNGTSAGPDGTTLTVTPTANTTYTLEAVNSCGTASARATATVTIGANPQAPVITPASAIIVSGTRAVLNATSSVAGATINWYSDANATILVNTGTSFTTPILNASTTYYVTTTVPGCGTSSPVSVLVTVIPPTPGTVDCGIATISALTGVNGVIVGASVFNDASAVDTDENTGSTLFIPAGALGASVFHRLGFTGGLSNIGDTLQIKISSPGKLLSAAVLPNLTLTTYNGSASNNDDVTLNSQFIQLDLATDGSEATLSFIPTAQFDGVELRLSSGLIGVLTSVDFNYARRIITKPEIVSTAVSACFGSSATLSVSNPKPNITYKWYQGSVYTGQNGVNFLTDATLPAGTYDFSVTATDLNGCESPKVDITVTITSPPAPPVPATTNSVSTCINTPVTLAVQSVAGVVYNWYDAATSGNLLVSNSSSFVTSANLSPGSYTYYVEAASSGGCTNATRTPVNIEVNQNAIATDIVISGNTALCNAGTTILTASSTTVTNPVFTWYSDASLSTPVFVGAAFTTPQINANVTYYVTVSGSNRCPNPIGNAASVSITINPVALASDINVTDASSLCAGSTTTLTATSTILNPIFTWYSDAALTTVVSTAPSFTMPALSTATTYYVTVKGSNRCENTPATAKAVVIDVNPLSTAADINITGLNIICSSATASLSASSVTVTNPVFTWYNDAALTSVAFVGASFTTPALTATTTYYVTVSGDNNCANSAANAKTITVTVKDYATAADITVNNANICSGSTATLLASSLTVTQPVFTWYSDASLTVPVFTGPTYNVAVSATTTFYVTVKGTNKCENAAADAKVVTINVNPLATSTDIIVAGNTAACAGSSAILTASSTTVTNPVFTWYSDASLTNISFVGASYTTPVLNANTTYYVTVKGDNKCENASSTARVVVITVNPAPANPVVSSTGTTICSGNTTTINIQNPQNGVSYEFYNAATGGNLISTGTSFTTPVLNSNTNYYIQAIGAGGCVNAAGRTMVTIVVNATPNNPVVATTGTAICSGNSTTLTVQNPQTAVTYEWYDAATGGNLLTTGSTFTTTVLTANVNYYLQAVGNGGCVNTGGRTLVAVTVSAAPSNPVVSSAGTNICSGNATTLNIQSPEVGVTYEWYNAVTGGNLLTTGTSYTTPVLTNTVNYYIQAIGAGGCFNGAGRTLITVTVNQQPFVPIVASATQNVCFGSAANLSVTNAQTGVTYNWYTSATGGAIAGSGSTFTTPSLTNNVTYYVEGVAGTCISSNRTAVSITVLPLPVAPLLVSATNGTICSGTTTVLNVNSPEPGLTYRWYATSTGGTVLGQGTTFTTPSLSANTTFYVESFSSAGCVSAVRTPVIVTVLPVLSIPVVRVETTTPASVTFSWNAISGATGYEVSLTNGATWQAPSNGTNATSHLIIGLKPDQAVTLIVRALGQIGCQTSANSTPVTGKASNPIGNDIYIPNIFSPNNDGKNDIFLVYGTTIAAVKMNVYTQWGQLIYQVNSTTTGWDGTYKGVPQPNGVYVYMIEIESTDGTKVMKKGTITLIR
ncbi:hypothetical protein D7004_01900 [Pedobacter jejuensis]|uniref:Fibronectin type-III domain-containing protein n=1 Tax=Pedobacter jejuensis TaxID=1268550 RepID=A0A3N0C2H6_9SPHI|nr:hypothetical protein D7004_01900 [Pedobacter jejuensis]